MGFAQGELILEIGRDDDVDSALRDSIESLTGSALIDSTTDEAVDGVLLWWRDGDGDLVDELMDAMTYLTDAGHIWLMTPKAGRSLHVEPSDIQDSAPIAGLTQTGTLNAAHDWNGTRLVARKASKR